MSASRRATAGHCAGRRAGDGLAGGVDGRSRRGLWVRAAADDHRALDVHAPLAVEADIEAVARSLGFGDGAQGGAPGDVLRAREIARRFGGLQRGDLALDEIRRLAPRRLARLENLKAPAFLGAETIGLRRELDGHQPQQQVGVEKQRDAVEQVLVQRAAGLHVSLDADEARGRRVGRHAARREGGADRSGVGENRLRPGARQQPLDVGGREGGERARLRGAYRALPPEFSRGLGQARQGEALFHPALALALRARDGTEAGTLDRMRDAVGFLERMRVLALVILGARQSGGGLVVAGEDPGANGLVRLQDRQGRAPAPAADQHEIAADDRAQHEGIDEAARGDVGGEFRDAVGRGFRAAFVAGIEAEDLAQGDVDHRPQRDGRG
jgi:hypothetical protein